MKPIIYNDTVDIRFSDLDLYNHVNSKHYIDFVSTTRLTFLAKRFDTTMDTLAKKGFGFYMTKSTVNYKRPIIDLQKVRAKSFVEEIRDEKVYVIKFELMTDDETKIFADGYIEFTVIDLNTKRASAAPKWFLDYFFETTDS
jgi:acyl-CoA thioester hydrolase